MAQIITTSSRKKTKSKSTTALLAVLVLVIVAAGCWFIFCKNAPKAKTQSAAAVPVKATEPKAKPVPMPEVGQPGVEVSPSALTAPVSSEPEPTNKITGLPQSQHEAWQKREAERHAREKEAMDLQSPEYFDNQTENTIARVSRPNAKFLVPPTLNVTGEELMKILDREIVIYEDDTPEAIETKERTAKMKEEIKAYIREGGTINQYFRDVLAENTEKDGIRNDVYLEKRRILLEKGEEAAQEYLDSVNPQLKEMGLEEQHISTVDLRWMQKELAKKQTKEGNGK